MTLPVSCKAAITEDILPFISKPSRYIAGEWNSVVKDPAAAEVRVALAFPDVYEIGMSHLGLKILYQLLNAHPDIMAERVYAPWLDAEARLRARGIPLCSQESGFPLSGFDVVGFTLQYELSFTTLLTMLELGGIPVRARDRRDGDPLVVAGGPVAFAPEPLADFIDGFLIGDGEEAAIELCAVVRQWKRHGGRRDGLLEAVKDIDGMYVPALHSPGEVVQKRTALRLGGDGVDYSRFPVPYMEIVHDRAGLEVMRGCAQGCRFCQAGYVYRPVRERSASSIGDMVERSVKGTGYEEISLSALSIADLSCLREVLPSLMVRLTPTRTSLSLPSLRVETLNANPELAAEIARVRKTGFTLAPEAGSERLRRVINKVGFDETAILAAVQNAARAGWESLKLYFMIGLPTEAQADLDEIVRIAREAVRVARRERSRGFGLTVSASSFVPKPHTPFQWFAQQPMEILQEKQAYLKARLRESRINFKWQQVESSFLEAVFTRGSREVGAAIALGQQRGCRFDGWTEQLKFDAWIQAFADVGVDPFVIANRPFGLETPLPWDHIHTGIERAFLLREYRRALDGEATPDCHSGPCNGCGEQCAPNWQAWARATALPPQASEGTGVSSASQATATSGPALIHPRQKIRFEFHKVGELRFLSHLELMRALARALRRAGIPLAFTQGFNPQPRLSLAQALAVGTAGLCELGEIELSQRMEPEEIRAAWNRQLSPELKILRAWEAPLNGPSLSAGVRGALYQIHLMPNGWDPTVLAGLGSTEACAVFAAQETIPVEVVKKGETVPLDARPFLQEFAMTAAAGGSPAWRMRLRVGPAGSVRPTAIMRSFLGARVPPGDLDHMVSSLRIARTALALEGQG